MDPMKDYFKQDRLARLLGMELLEVAPGTATARMAVREDHFNAVNIVHGGALFSLADFTFAAASNARGKAAVAINATISYMRPVSSGTLTAKAEEVNASTRLATYLIRITDEQGRQVALFQGTVFRKEDPLPFAS
jgi:acyl-CoA thioesterase